MTISSRRTISVVINTDARVDSLRTTLQSLRYLNYPAFEVCVVYGPTQDGTKELLDNWVPDIKVAQCSTRNLSLSRNIGIGLASGEIIAFLDDDSIPEPEWLDEIVKPFDDPRVAACGGFLYDHTGFYLQWRFGTANRLGRADKSWQRPTPEFNFPFSANFPHVMANSAFRKSALLAIGGFDEHYEYFLDETDVICRLVDHGLLIEQLAGAGVHHKFKPSRVRDRGVIKSWYAIIRSKIYFSLVNSHGHHSVGDAIKDAQSFIEEFRSNLDWGVSLGLANDIDRARFEPEIDRAWRDGLTLGLANQRRLINSKAQVSHHPFTRFSTLAPLPGRRTFCFLTKTYPPRMVGGIGRYIHQIARSVAALGHQVHVLTQGSEQNTVDFEDAVWVHRICPKPSPRPHNLDVPQHIWDYSAAMLDEVRRIATGRQIDAVYAPIWDCEGLSFALCDDLPLITGLQTTLHFWLQNETHRASDRQFMAEFAKPMLALEKLVLERSAGIHAISGAIARDIEAAYGIRLQPPRTKTIPLGQEDWTMLPAEPVEPSASGQIRLLFVGRLEERKGIDVLLRALKEIMPRYPQLSVDIVGNDKLPGADGKAYRDAFESDAEMQSARARIRFHGEVSEKHLRGFYRACDIFVAPSRFESFGLILLEAMMFGKPVIGCRTGGMPEIVEDGVSGLLAEPGDVDSLERCITRLIEDPDLRDQLGVRARRRYEDEFTSTHMAVQIVDFLTAVAGADRLELAAGS